MKTLHSKISRLTLALTLVLIFIGTTNQIKAQFTSPTFMVNNNSGCTVDVFFEFQNACGGPWTCCLWGFVVNVAPGASVPVAVTPGGDALMRVYPYGYGCAAPCYYFGDFSTSPLGLCFSPSVNAMTPVSGDDCNGNPNALNAVVNVGCANCLTIY